MDNTFAGSRGIAGVVISRTTLKKICFKYFAQHTWSCRHMWKTCTLNTACGFKSALQWDMLLTCH